MREMQETRVRSLSWEDPRKRKWQHTPVFLPEKSVRIGEPGGRQSIGSQRSGHDWACRHILGVRDWARNPVKLQVGSFSTKQLMGREGPEEPREPHPRQISASGSFCLRSRRPSWDLGASTPLLAPRLCHAPVLQSLQTPSVFWKKQ